MMKGVYSRVTMSHSSLLNLRPAQRRHPPSVCGLLGVCIYYISRRGSSAVCVVWCVVCRPIEWHSAATPLPSAGVSIRMERGCQQNESLADSQAVHQPQESQCPIANTSSTSLAIEKACRDPPPRNSNSAHCARTKHPGRCNSKEVPGAHRDGVEVLLPTVEDPLEPQQPHYLEQPAAGAAAAPKR